ncbi:MAG TPA: Nramp family divalent metal transporter [Bryobacterales bacterium]|nr:Nramp family divalent metal transporter [Bryobacterales bacterium]
MFGRLRTRLLVFLAVLGPGFITAVVDNDAGGIFTYSEAGARFGYNPLWTMIPVTVILVITQVMCSRMGAVTGKGLSDLIREEFGLRTTFLVMAALLTVNMTNVTANFAGIAGSLGLFGVSHYISVPLGAVVVWLLVVKGTYRSVEKIFLVSSLFYVSYVISAILVEPDWEQAIESSVIPVVYFDGPYLAILVGLVGTSVAPWMQFYLQAAIVEKGVDVKQFAESRAEVIVGCVAMAFIKFFIIVCAAGAIWSVQPREIHDAAEAALALRPLGPYAYYLFAGGLFNASLLAASILPLSTAYSVCEGLGFESGVNYRFEEARIFYWLYTLLIVVGAGLVLWPNFPLVRMILLSQVLNGILLPVIMILILRLVNRRDLMGEWVNSRFYNVVAYSTVVVMIGLSLAVVGLTLWNGKPL